MAYAKVSWASPYKEEDALRRSVWGNTTYLSVICLRLISLRRHLIIYKQVDCTGAFDLLNTSPTLSTCTQTFATTLFVDHARFGCTFFSFAAAAANLDQVTHDEIEVSSEESCTRLYQLFCLCTPVGSRELLVVVDIIPKTCEHYLVSFPSKMTQRICFAFWEWTMVPNSS